LLLFGLYRVSVDPTFLTAEVSQLTFNFTSLQFYELLLVGTAMFLARRLIWYDAKLLVTMENLLVLVPFMLVSQAALIDERTVWIFCGAAALFAVARSALAQRGVTVLKFPPRLALIGFCTLAVNCAWPIVYRTFQNTRAGINITSGAAYVFNELNWLWLLPMVIALANLLPRPRESGKSPVQGRRFPVGIFALWLVGTVAHLYALGYVYDFKLRLDQVAPSLWVIAWTLHLRLPDHFEYISPSVKRLMPVLPLLVTLVAASATGSNVFFTLNTANLVAFAWLAWKERGNRLALHLAMLSSAAMLAAAPPPLFHFVAGWFNRSDLIGLAVLAYVMIGSLLTRNPKAAIAGGIAAAIAGGAMRNLGSDTWHWAAQFGIVFFLLHSLRWRDYEHSGAPGVRIFMAACWLIHTAIWVRDDAAIWQPLIIAGAVLFVWALRGFVFQRWTPLVVPGAAALVGASGPANFVLVKLAAAPLGVVAILGSFLLFVIGTAVALTKHRWYCGTRPELAADRAVG
jgi:hypothetical protein